MKIVITISNLGGGGAERVGVMLAEGFASRGHEVIIATDLTISGHYAPSDAVRMENIITFKKNVLLKWISAIWNLRRLFNRENPDVVIGIMQLCSFTSWVASRGLRFPVIATEHNSFQRPTSAPMKRSDYLAKYWVNNLYNHVTVLTTSDKYISYVVAILPVFSTLNSFSM